MFSKQSLTHLFSGVCTSCSRVLWMIKCLIDIFLNGNIILVLLKIKIHFSFFSRVYTRLENESEKNFSTYEKKFMPTCAETESKQSIKSEILNDILLLQNAMLAGEKSTPEFYF